MQLESIPVIRALFAVRSLALCSAPAKRDQRGFLDEMTALGWMPLLRQRHVLVMGAVTEPWAARPRFTSPPPDQFAAFDTPGHVKIVWNLECVPLGTARCDLRTETRAYATDPVTLRRFRRYWRAFGLGTALLRFVALRRVKHDAEAGLPRSTLRAAIDYFAPVYACAFALGACREAFVVSRFGRPAGVALESIPLALAIGWSASRNARRAPLAPDRRLAIGLAALLLLAPLELGGVLARRRSLADYLRSQRSFAGCLFGAVLVWFAIAPLILGSVSRNSNPGKG
jgi:hypothetical protein